MLFSGKHHFGGHHSVYSTSPQPCKLRCLIWCSMFFSQKQTKVKKLRRAKYNTTVITKVFLDLVSSVLKWSCIFNMQYTENSGNLHFIPCSFHAWRLIFKNSPLVPFLFPSLPLLLLEIQKGLRKDLFLIITFLWWQICYAFILTGDCNGDSMSRDIQGNWTFRF